MPYKSRSLALSLYLPHSFHAQRMGIVVENGLGSRGFDPKKTWPVLIVFSSSDHLYPNWYDLVGWYRKTALAEGWVLLAGDGPKPPTAPAGAPGTLWQPWMH